LLGYPFEKAIILVFNVRMLFLLVKIDNYKQLQLINQALTEDIRNYVKSVADRSEIPIVYEREGLFLLSLGRREEAEAGNVVEFAVRLVRYLKDKKEELFGFNTLFLAAREEDPEALRIRGKQALLRIEGEEGIWLEEGARGFFASVADLEQTGCFWALSPKSVPETKTIPAYHLYWESENILDKVVEAIDVQHESGEPGTLIAIHGSAFSERRLLINGLQNKLQAVSAAAVIPRVAMLFKRRSPIHPFLNSIDSFFLLQVPQYLHSHELAVWKEVGFLLDYLKAAVKDIRLSPDHIYEDFYLAYQLYLSACFRRMEENFLPGLLFCENVDSYHPRTLRCLKRLIRDFSSQPSFIPVLTVGDKEQLKEFSFMRVKRLILHPLNSRKIASLSASLLPGIHLPERDCRYLRRLTKGRLIPLIHVLKYLRDSGNIKEEDSRYSLASRQELKTLLPEEAAEISWAVIQGLPEEQRRVLYIVYLQAGLLNVRHLRAFLHSLDLSEEAARTSLDRLAADGLITGREYILPLFPALKTNLALLQGESGLEEELAVFLLALWREGRFPHLVLLFFLLLRMNKAAHAGKTLDVLERLLEQKLSEIDFSGLRLILNQRQLQLALENHPPPAESLALSGEETRELKMIVMSARMRALLLAGNLQGAEELSPEALALTVGYDESPAKSRLFLQVARYYGMKGEMSISLDWVKRALIQYQNLGHLEGELNATVHLGEVMLAEGKPEEALEYLSFSEHTTRNSYGLATLRALCLSAVTLAISGNLSRAQSTAERSSELAAALMSREWELAMLFLRGRIKLDLGNFAEAVELLEQGVALAELYSLRAVKRVFTAWLGRTYAYKGDARVAFLLLKSEEENRERCYFLAETCFLSGDFAGGLEYCSRALSQAMDVSMFPGERPVWTDGFSSLEGRCFSLFGDNALLVRLIKAFQAFLMGLTGNAKQGIAQLYSLTRGEKLPAVDPYLSLYHYYYASTLPEVGRGQVDDGLTVLNKALKLLQQRASCIENSSLRWQYLHKNLWNARIFEDSQRRNLL
jgi:tetratricopeptide (TPR) repeat protein